MMMDVSYNLARISLSLGILLIITNSVASKPSGKRMNLKALTIKYQQMVCPNGFIRYETSCYKFSTMKATWVEANTYCSAMRASLVSIETPHENKFLIGHIKRQWPTLGLSFWTGGNDLASEGQWTWVANLKPIRFGHWYVSQPDNGGKGSEHCLELEKQYIYHWNDQPCHLLNHFICEIDNLYY
ncbi:unnamed protein product [Owenia fusiformis]|uniref:Uncharacterized protein n=1 Tax=Owenia fusiformis TaxID=6347 RepID=A0A8J1XF25_OWEFU|nr:unnamed protein product [Owenia fusiformis]